MTDSPQPPSNGDDDDAVTMGTIERRIVRGMKLFFVCGWPLCLLLALLLAYRELAHMRQADFGAASETVFLLGINVVLCWQAWLQWRHEREGDAVFALLVWLALLLYWY